MKSFKHQQKGSAFTNLVGGIAILGAGIFLLAKLANSGYSADVAEITDSATKTRIVPVGSLKLGDGAEPGQRTGKQVFDKVCSQCHAADSATAYSPKVTHNADWAPRIAKGLDALKNSALNGFTGQGTMPARGGSPDLTDDEVVRAIVYMANESGGHFTEPAVAASGAASASAASGAATATASAGGVDPSSVEAQAKAKEHFESICVTCHGANSQIPFAPKVTHNADWAPRIKQGKETLFKHAIEGFTGKDGGVMAPRGGSSFSDDEMKAIVIYMANQSGAHF